MKKEIDSTTYGFVCGIEYVHPFRSGGSIVIPLTNYLPEGKLLRVIVLDCNKKRTQLVIESVVE